MNFLMRVFIRENFPWVGKFPGCELVRGNYALGELAKIPKQNSFFDISCFLFSVSILLIELLRVIVLNKFSMGLNYSEDIFVLEGISSWSWVRFSGII